MNQKRNKGDELMDARKEYEELFKEKPSNRLSTSEIRKFIKEANEDFEKDFP